MSREIFITTNEAAGVLGVTRQRILQLIQDGRIRAEKFANVYMIRRGDLDHIEEKPMGRPPKAAKNGTIETQTKTTRRLSQSVKRDADKEMGGGRKGGKK
jgi:excisionase family DNA binding protein